MRTAMGSALEAIKTEANWYVPVFENFVDTYHLVVMPGDSGLGDHFLQVWDKVLNQWKGCLEKRSRLPRAGYQSVGRSIAQDYEASSDARFTSYARLGPIPAEASRDPSPSTSAKSESSGHASPASATTLPTRIGACPKI